MMGPATGISASSNFSMNSVLMLRRACQTGPFLDSSSHERFFVDKNSCAQGTLISETGVGQVLWSFCALCERNLSPSHLNERVIASATIAPFKLTQTDPS